MRYFIDQDQDCHYYLIPEESRGAWDLWSNLDQDDEASWDVPSFAQRVDSPYRITFENPIVT